MRVACMALCQSLRDTYPHRPRNMWSVSASTFIPIGYFSAAVAVWCMGC